MHVVGRTRIANISFYLEIHKIINCLINVKGGWDPLCDATELVEMNISYSGEMSSKGPHRY